MAIERRIYSFKEMTDIAKLIIGSKSKNLTDFSEGSDLLAMTESFVYFVEFMQTELNKGIDAFSINNADGTLLENRIYEFGMEKNPEVFGSTPAKFGRNTPATADFYVYAGSQISTEPDDFGSTIDYTLDDDIFFPSGSMYVTGTITCTQGGLIGNVPSGTITNMTSSIPGIDYVTNESAVVNGANEETPTEIKTRLPIHLNGLKSSNRSAIEAAVLGIPGTSIVKVERNVPAQGQVTIYVSTQSGVLTDEQIADIKEAAESEVAFGIIPNIATPTITYVNISFDAEYDDENFKKESVAIAVKNAILNLVSINPESKLKLWDVYLTAKIPGITNISNLLIDGVASDKTVEGFSAIRLASINNISINWLN